MLLIVQPVQGRHYEYIFTKNPPGRHSGFYKAFLAGAGVFFTEYECLLTTEKHD